MEQVDAHSKSADCLKYDCRICMCEISPVQQINIPDHTRTILLKNPCACKGTLSYVHEACLVKWLLQRNIRTCELCK